MKQKISSVVNVKRVRSRQLGQNNSNNFIQKISISCYSLPQNSEKVQITVFMPNQWNIQTFTISLQTF